MKARFAMALAAVCFAGTAMGQTPETPQHGGGQYRVSQCLVTLIDEVDVPAREPGIITGLQIIEGQNIFIKRDQRRCPVQANPEIWVPPGFAFRPGAIIKTNRDQVVFIFAGLFPAFEPELYLGFQTGRASRPNLPQHILHRLQNLIVAWSICMTLVYPFNDGNQLCCQVLGYRRGHKQLFFIFV